MKQRRIPTIAMAAAALLLVVVVGVLMQRRSMANGEVPPPIPTAPVMATEQVRSFPHDPNAFTQGLEYRDGRLYESTGRHGESTLREVELETGRVLRRVDLAPHLFGEGLTILDDRIYQITWQAGLGFVYDLATFQEIRRFEYQGEGWGLANDGTSLIMSDGSNRLRFYDPETFALTRVLEVWDGPTRLDRLNELEWVRGEIWANVWHSEHVARIDPRTGRVIAWLDLSGLYPRHLWPDPEAVLNGIAYDAGSDRLFVTGKLWPNVFEIRVPGLIGDPPVTAEPPAEENGAAEAPRAEEPAGAGAGT